jgi:hypothetical protein
MSAIVSQERAKSAWLTGTTGLALLLAAFLMMLVGAPAHAEHGPAKPSAVPVPVPVSVRLTADPCHRLTSKSDSTTLRACLIGPVAPGARAQAYTPSMTSDSWSASSPSRETAPS